MAKPVAKLSGVFLRPAVSRNGRKYTKETIGKAVGRMQDRIKTSGSLPITMNSSHKATMAGDVTKTGAVVTNVWQEDDGTARFEANVLDTQTGRDIAALALPAEDGSVGLRGVSIFGRWLGNVRNENGCETADDLEVTGIDFTHYPGVEGAQIDQAQLAEMAAAGLFGESLEEVAFVDQITEEVPMRPDGTPPVAEAKDQKKPFGSVAYADPGYKNGVARYPIDTKAHAKAAWAYINMPKNQKGYTPAQVARIKSKIKAAAKKFGIDVQAESDFLTGEIAEVLEAYASMSISNGGGSVSASGYTSDSKEIKALAQRIALAAMAGMDTLDPDNDDDVDVDSAECASCEMPLSEGHEFCPSCGHQVSEAAPPTQRKEPTVADHTAEQVKALLTSEQAASLDPTKESYSSEELKALLAPKESANPNAAILEALATLAGVKVEAQPAKKAKATKEQKLEKARKLIEKAESKSAKLTPEAMIEAAKAAAVEAVQSVAVRDFRQAPTRKGLVESLEAIESDSLPAEKLAELSTEELGERVAMRLQAAAHAG